MQWCKKIQYMILYHKKLDLLKRDKEWQLDKVDAIFGIIFWTMFIIMFISAHFFGDLFAYLFIFMGYMGGIVGYIRNIKSVPADIESKLMSPMICVGIVFFSGLLITAMLIAIGRILNQM